MKKIVLFLTACVLLTAALSCQKEVAGVPAEDEQLVEVVFCAQNPEPACKSALDDASALTAGGITFMAYKPGDANTYTYLDDVRPSAVDYNADTHVFTLKVRMVKDVTCRVVLVAQSDNGYYSINKKNATLTASSTLPLNDAAADLFTASAEVTPTGNKPQVALSLKRAVAQINLLSDEDLAGAGVTSLKMTLSLDSAPQQLDLINGTVSGTQQVTYTQAERIADGTKLDGAETYTWLASAFVLAGPDNSSSTVTWTAKGGDVDMSRTQEGVTFKRNNRTNIIGSILCL